MVISNPPCKNCLCGLSVHTGAQIIVWLRMCTTVLWAFWTFPQGAQFYVGHIFVCILLLYGLHIRHPLFYVPYFVWPFIHLIIIYFVPYNHLSILTYLHNEYQKHETYVSIFYIILFVVAVVVTLYFEFFVPWLSFRLLRFEKRDSTDYDGVGDEPFAHPRVEYTPA